MRKNPPNGRYEFRYSMWNFEGVRAKPGFQTSLTATNGELSHCIPSGKEFVNFINLYFDMPCNEGRYLDLKVFLCEPKWWLKNNPSDEP